MQITSGYMGIIIGTAIILLWLGHLLYILLYADLDLQSPLMYLHVLLQTFLYTGLFITAHDAMHGSVAANRKVNNTIGHTATTLFAFLSFSNLSKKHYQHHRHPATDEDPDFSPRSNNFFVWWSVFIRNYITWQQILLMAIMFNILLLWFSELRLIMFWIVPAVLSTFQLFFFGTYIPHRRPFTKSMEPHFSRTLPRNHFRAMITCYFFGYHWEHHEKPTIPWWQLYKQKK